MLPPTSTKSGLRTEKVSGAIENFTKANTNRIIKKKIIITDDKKIPRPLLKTYEVKKSLNSEKLGIKTGDMNLNKNENSKLESNLSPEDQFKLDGEIFRKFLDQFAQKALGDKKIIKTDEKDSLSFSKLLPISPKSPLENINLMKNKKENYPVIEKRRNIDRKEFTNKLARPQSEYRIKTSQKENMNMTNTKIRPISSLKDTESANVIINEKGNTIINEEKKGDFGGRINDYVIGKEIGKGAYAVVKQAMHKPTGLKLAIKQYDKFKLMDQSRKSAVKREIQIMKNLDHPNIVKLYEVIDTPKQIWIVMELIKGVSLLSFLKSKPNRKLEEIACKNIFIQIMRGINYLHSENVFHRDIKLENIIINDSQDIKIIDFGFGTCNPKSKLLNFFCGTPSYMPPEIIQKKDYLGSSADIWSIGILLFTLLCGVFPFRGLSEKELYSKIIKGVYIIPEHISSEAKNLIENILIVNPNSRMSSNNILLHVWLS